MCSGYVLSGQTFPGQGGVLIPPGAPNETVGISTSPATVTGVGILGEGCVQIENVTMDVDHTWDGDIALFLVAPSGEVLELSSGNGGAGDDFKITVFTDFTTPFITEGMPPFNGTFRPEGRQQSTTPPFPNVNPLGTFTFQNTFDGVNADGDWILLINDYVSVDVGIINSWSITFSQGGGTAPEVDLGPDITACSGETFTLFADVDPGADWYAWSTGDTDESISVAPTETTSYYVTVSYNGCIDADTIEIVIDNTLVADAGPDVEICEGESVLLTATGGGPSATYLWNTDQTGPEILVSPNVSSGYSVTITEGSCTASDVVLVIVTPIPVADAGPDVSICEGEFVTLQANGGSQGNDYTWSTGQSGDEITVSPNSTTVYTVTVNVNGCEDEDEVEVFVTPAPTVDAGPDEEICIGNDVTLIATGSGGVYTWSTGEEDEVITVSPTSTSIYTVTLEDNGCIATDDIEVTVIEVIADAGPDVVICEGDDAVLTASGGSAYEWSTGQNGSTINVSPVATTTYTVTVTTGACSDEAIVEVEVLDTPVADITPDQTICQGENANLTVNGGGTYLWSTGETSADITVSPTQTTTYFATVTNQVCSAVVQSTVFVNTTPSAFAGPDQTICDGTTVVLTATGGGTYMWNTGQSTAEINVNPNSTTTYFVTVTDANGCEATDEVNVIVQPVPIADAGNNQFIMVGGSASLQASGGGTYFWSTGETTSGINVSPLVTTTYFVTVTLGICSSVDEVTIFVDEVPSVDLGPDLQICAGESVSLDATITGPFSLTYVWSTGETSGVINVMPLADTSYSVTVTNTVSGFATVDTINVMVNSLPLGLPEITGSINFCSGTMTSYLVTGVTNATVFDWQVSSGGVIVSGQGTPQIDVNWLTPGNGMVQVIVSNPCGALPSVLLDVVVQGPPITPGPISGEANPCAEATTPYAVPQQADATSYQWTLSGGGLILSGQGTSSVLIDWNSAAGGELCVTATNACGVSPQLCQTIVTTSTPVLSAGADDESCGLMYTLQGTGTGTWALVNGPGLATFSNPSIGNSIVSVDVPGVFLLSFSSQQSGCIGYDEMTIQFLDIPVINGVTENCTGALEDYTVSFTITGGQAPYIVNGQPLSGNTYTSSLISAGTSYSFQVADANGCLSSGVNGTQECQCSTTAGQMSQEEKSACVGQDITAEYLGGGNPQPGEVLAFVLHDGNIPGGIIDWNQTATFGFQDPMVVGVTYFISAVVGPPDASGFPDLSAACTAISNATPVIFVAPPEAILATDARLGCDPQMVLLDIGGSTTGTSVQYQWSTTDGGSIEGPPNTSVITALTAGTYLLTVIDVETGCQAKDSMIVYTEAFAPTGLAFQTVSPLCPGECNGTVEIIQVQPDWSFDFGDGVFTPDPLFLMACGGINSLVVSDSLGCLFDTIYEVSEPLPITVDLGPDQVVVFGDAVTLTATTSSDVEFYNWFDADSCLNCSSIMVQPPVTTTYMVQVSDVNGCTAADEVVVTVTRDRALYMPNVFSPNGDQINDVFFIADNRQIDLIERFEIFDRWGNLVFMRTNFIPGSTTDGWNGMKNGEAMNPAVFTWSLRARWVDGETTSLAGDVTLVK